MCFGMTDTKQVTSAATANPAVQAATEKSLGYASNLLGPGSTFGQQYGGDLVASLSPGQSGTIDAATNIANNNTGAVAGNLITGYGGAGPQSVSTSSIADNMSPYMNQYVMMALAPQLHQMDINNAADMARVNSTATSSGAFGDARAGIEAANTAFGQNVAREGLIGNAYNAAFNTAIGAGAQDVANKMSADTTNANFMETALGRQLAAAQGLQGLQTQQLGAQTSANALNQQTTAQQQAELTAAYNNWLQAQQSALQGLGGLNQSIAAGASALPATKTETTAQPDNSGWALGGTLLGAFLSDARTKEDIAPVGALLDGTPVFSYHYKADPLKRKQIGLMAQDVKERRPDAVLTLPDEQGTMMVDYGRATERSRLLSMAI